MKAIAFDEEMAAMVMDAVMVADHESCLPRHIDRLMSAINGAFPELFERYKRKDLLQSEEVLMSRIKEWAATEGFGD